MIRLTLPSPNREREVFVSKAQTHLVVRPFASYRPRFAIRTTFFFKRRLVSTMSHCEHASLSAACASRRALVSIHVSKFSTKGTTGTFPVPDLGQQQQQQQQQQQHRGAKKRAQGLRRLSRTLSIVQSLETRNTTHSRNALRNDESIYPRWTLSAATQQQSKTPHRHPTVSNLRDGNPKARDFRKSWGREDTHKPSSRATVCVLPTQKHKSKLSSRSHSALGHARVRKRQHTCSRNIFLRTTKKQTGRGRRSTTRPGQIIFSATARLKCNSIEASVRRATLACRGCICIAERRLINLWNNATHIAKPPATFA